MAQVYLAHHEGLGRSVAVKRLRRHLANLEEARDRLRAEADITRELRHDHIVNVLDLVTDPTGDTYLVMEHVAGEPLSARLARGGALPLSEALIVGLQVADALEAVHRRGILHRDLKTENVLLGLKPDGTLLAKLIDFGVAEILSSPDGVVEARTVVGTPESMAPEQALVRPTDRRSDIYSFGVLLYEMVAGVPPFQGDDLPSLLQRVVGEAPLPPSQQPGAQKQLIPAALETLILDCLAKSPDRRPQHMSDVRARLEAIAAAYQSLTEAVEEALESARSTAADTGRVVKQALVVVEEPVVRPVAAPSPVRAVGTSENTRVLARPIASPRTAAPWSGELLIESEPEPAVALRGRGLPARAARPQDEDRSAEGREQRSQAHRQRPLMVQVLRTGLVVAALAAGGVGLLSILGSTPSSDHMESPWPHRPDSPGR